MDSKARRDLNKAACKLSAVYRDMLKLHAMGQSIPDLANRERYVRSLRGVLDHLASANRTLEDLLRADPAAPP